MTKDIVIGAVCGIVLMSLLPIHSVGTVRLYCTEGGLLGCDWDKGMIIEDWLYFTIPR